MHNDDVETCKRNGWTVGTRLTGDEGYGPTTIEITYLSDQTLLAKRISTPDGRYVGEESSWTLMCRDWVETPR